MHEGLIEDPSLPKLLDPKNNEPKKEEKEEYKDIKDIKLSYCEKEKKEGIKEAEELAEGAQSKRKHFLHKLLKRYNLDWLILWQSTKNFHIWRHTHSHTLYCLSELVDVVTNCTVHYENGDIYNGEVYKGKRNGTGILAFDNGNGLYEGEWKDDKRYGHGNQSIGNSKYSGQFVE